MSQGFGQDRPRVSFSLPPLTITILEGDITARGVDAIVNAANNELWMGSGVAGAIKAKGGVQIEREAMAQGPVNPGQAVLTSAGSLPARFVIHAAVMGQDLHTDATLIGAATASTLSLAATRGLTSIAFPALGTGVGGFPIGECARVMLRGDSRTRRGIDSYPGRSSSCCSDSPRIANSHRP